MTNKDKTLELLGKFLEKKIKREEAEERARKWQKPKDILLYLAIIGTCIFAPNALRIFKPLVEKKEKIPSWFSFDKRYLKRTIERLRRQKEVKIETKKGQIIVSVTDYGRKRLMKRALEELEIPKPKEWDGKWRAVSYDIPSKRKLVSQALRQHLGSLGFLLVQRSLYIYPYPCLEEIEILRSYYNLDKELDYLVISELENDRAYRRYFDLV